MNLNNVPRRKAFYKLKGRKGAEGTHVAGPTVTLECEDPRLPCLFLDGLLSDDSARMRTRTHTRTHTHTRARTHTHAHTV